MTKSSVSEIGDYRPAHRVREGWQIRFLPTEEGGSVEWLTVTRILRVYSPVNLVLFTFGEEGEQAGTAHDADVFCRTLTEVRKAEGVA